MNNSAQNIASVIETHAPDLPAIVQDGRSISYGELRTLVGSMRAGLKEAGIAPGHRVLLVGENEVDFVVAALAILGVGAMAAPARGNTPLPELKRKVVSVDPEAIVVCSSAEWLVEHEAVLGYRILRAEDLALSSPDTTGVVARDSDDLAFLMLTSGVASDAKVAMLSHGNLGWIQEQIVGDAEYGLDSNDVALGVLPMTHIFGLNVVLFGSLRAGAKIILQPRFDVDESLRLVREHGVTMLTGAPPMWQRWATAADVPASSLATVRRAVSGAAALPIETFLAIRDRFGVEIAEGYGLTETSPVVTRSKAGEIRPTSVGRVMDGVEVVLVEEDGTPVETGDSGEIVVRGPGVFKGYLGAAELTANVLTEDGWFWTGDVGVFDSDGYLYIVDRIKDIVIVSGFNVYPGEVETVLMEHPGVEGAVVVGTPHGDTGEAVVAHVSGSADLTELDSFVRARLSRYKCPTEYHFVDELPVSPNGKVIRRALR